MIVVAVAGTITANLMEGLADLVEVAVEAVAGVIVIGTAQVLRGHAAMKCRLAVAGLGVGAEAGAGVTLGTVVLAAAGAVALVLAVGLKGVLLALGLHVLTRGTQSTKVRQKNTVQMTI